LLYRVQSLSVFSQLVETAQRKKSLLVFIDLATAGYVTTLIERALHLE
jgi:hypothetical protein